LLKKVDNLKVKGQESEVMGEDLVANRFICPLPIAFCPAGCLSFISLLEAELY
jgi:hypothetical protein